MSDLLRTQGVDECNVLSEECTAHFLIKLKLFATPPNNLFVHSHWGIYFRYESIPKMLDVYTHHILPLIHHTLRLSHEVFYAGNVHDLYLAEKVSGHDINFGFDFLLRSCRVICHPFACYFRIRLD